MSFSAIDTARRLLGDPTLAVMDASGGGNSHVARLVSGNGSVYAMKRYPSEDGRGRQRLESEQAALSFLESIEELTVPRLLAVDKEKGITLMSWIDGTHPASTGVDEVDAMVGFLTRLHGQRVYAGAFDLPDASDAIFSLQELTGQIRRRLESLAKAADRMPELKQHMEECLMPVIDRTIAWAEYNHGDAMVEHDKPLDKGLRTLSPSDLGVHNMLCMDGGYGFVDFEYFGWDDPAKLVCDFQWRPEPVVSDELTMRFVDRILKVYGDDPEITARCRLYGPLIGLCWSMIVLNPLKPGWLEARGAAEEGPARTGEYIDKSRSVVDRVRDAIEGGW